MKTDISAKFTFPKLLKFTMPSIIMLICMSLYTIVDGLFVSNMIGSDALSAVNISFPLTCIILAISLMFATGGGAIVAYELGSKNTQKANSTLSLMTISALVLGTVFMIIFMVFADPLLRLLGADDNLIAPCKSYFLIVTAFMPMSVLQILFQSYFVAASKPNLGFVLTIIGGVVNVVFDYILIKFTPMGINGAALATGLGYSVTAIGGVFFFFCNKRGLHFGKVKFDATAIVKAMFNGSSEMVTNLASCVTTMIFNIYMMKMLGSKGVAAISVILYSQFLLSSIFLGFSIGVAPILGYSYGAGDTQGLKKYLKICYAFVMISSVAVTIIAFFSSVGIAKIFSNGNLELQQLITTGMRIFAFAFLFMGFNIFTSSMFTSMSDGLSSAIVSFCRTIVFTIILICVLPLFFGVTGLWLSLPLSELCAIIVSIICMKIQLKRNFKKIEKREIISIHND